MSKCAVQEDFTHSSCLFDSARVKREVIDVSVDVNSNNWPIIGYTRSWHTEMRYWKQCLQAGSTLPSFPSPHAVFTYLFSMYLKQARTEFATLLCSYLYFESVKQSPQQKQQYLPPKHLAKRNLFVNIRNVTCFLWISQQAPGDTSLFGL